MGKRTDVRFIVYSDLHLEDWKKFNEGGRRITNALDVVKRITLVAKKTRADILFCGDLFHRERSVTNKLLSKVLPKLSRYWSKGNPDTYAITGNHDQSEANLIGKESPSYVRTFANSFPSLHCIDLGQVEMDDCIIFGVPYLTHDIGIVEYINSLKPSKKKVNILMLHMTMPGAKDTDGRPVDHNVPVNEFEKAIAKFDIVLCGHIHSPHRSKIIKTDIIQVGAPQHQRLTDRDCDMGYWVIYKNWDIEFIHMGKYPRFNLVKKKSEITNKSDFNVLSENLKTKNPKKKKRTKFTKDMDRRKLARNYLKEKGVEDKKKQRALVKALRND